jgi:dolichol-phosphate mannosyltransferase
VIKKLYNYYGNKIVTRNGFECAIEILLKLIYINTTITEIPMVLDTGKRYGKSKMKILKTIIGYFAIFFLKGGWKRQVSAYCKKG